jgi:hypothetical protein
VPGSCRSPAAAPRWPGSTPADIAAVAEALTGTEGFERDLTALTFERVRAGVFAPVTDTVQQVTGRPARSLAAFLADAAPALGRAG